MGKPLEDILRYHQNTKHHFRRYAPGPGYLDWSTQPDPFRYYEGAPRLTLPRAQTVADPVYDAVFVPGQVHSKPVELQSLSSLFFNSLAISAWKKAGGEAWALRVNPSSGNLHPTEGYLISGPMAGLSENAGVYHYAPKEHALEVRATIPDALWCELSSRLPPGAFLIGLSSIFWREAWKYGERAYRYCHLDVGHAIAAISLSAAGLGWRAILLDSPPAEALVNLMGLSNSSGPEREHPDALLLILPNPDAATGSLQLKLPSPSQWDSLHWQGLPNQLSRAHTNWDIIETVAKAAEKHHTSSSFPLLANPGIFTASHRSGLSFSRIVRTRRSAVAMDGHSRMPSSTFFDILARTLPHLCGTPHATLTWSPKIHLVLFVHRVDGLSSGLYLLVRKAAAKPSLQNALLPGFLWKRPGGCPDALDLYQLVEGDLRQTAMQLSCFQDIAAEGCFSVSMLADFSEALEMHGPWFYPRLFWECGCIGQLLYLEAEAAGLRSTGIGCFFDDPFHDLLGIKTLQFQDLYHLTLGGAVEDSRLSTLPAYPD